MDILKILELALIVVTAIVEYIMVIKWVPSYFNRGIPCYSKRLINRADALLTVDENDLNNLSESAASGFITPLVFKKIAEGQWAFRQRSFRFSMMHGKLFIEPETSNVRLVSFVNWYCLFLFIAIIFTFPPTDLFVVIIMPVMVILYYFLEKAMYDRVIRYLSENEVL